MARSSSSYEKTLCNLGMLLIAAISLMPLLGKHTEDRIHSEHSQLHTSAQGKGRHCKVGILAKAKALKLSRTSYTSFGQKIWNHSLTIHSLLYYTSFGQKSGTTPWLLIHPKMTFTLRMTVPLLQIEIKCITIKSSLYAADTQVQIQIILQLMVECSFHI